jgi:hypothetical protein
MIDLNQVESDRPVIPNGTYSLKIVDAAIKPTKSNSGKYVEFKAKIVGGTYKNQHVFGRLNIYNQSVQAQEIGRKQLKQLLVAANCPTLLFDSSDLLIGLKFDAKLFTEISEFGSSVKIGYFSPCTTTEDPIVPTAGDLQFFADPDLPF